MRKPRSVLAGAAALSFFVAVAGCSPYAPVRDPLPPTVAFSRAWSSGDESAEAGGSRVDRWWESLGQPHLSASVERAVRENFQVRAAWARVRQADMLGMQASSAWWPQLSAQIDASRRRTVLVLGDLGTRVIENDNFGISLPVSYEIDFWDRIGSQVRAAGFDAMAAIDDVETLAMTVAANVVEAWLNVVYQRALRATIEAQIETSEESLALLEARFAEGLATAPDVLGQRAQLEALRSQLAASEAQEAVAEAQLAVLLGRMPGAVEVPDEIRSLPDPPPLPALGVPSDLLTRRPDVRAARRRLEAADQRVAAAIADRLPRFTLSGAIGFASPVLENLFESFVYNVLGSLLGPLFDGERREAVVQQSHAVVWERTELLAQAMLTAAQEVESALVQERRQREQIAVLEERADAARAALETSRERYAAGLLDGYLQVLTALAAEQQAEQALLQARRQLLSHRVQLHRALGGEWTRGLERPEPHRPVADGRGADEAS